MKETNVQLADGGDPRAIEAFPVSFAIFAMARSHKALAGILLRKLDLYPNQDIILMALWNQEGLSEKALQETLQVDHSTVAKSIKRMETAGLIVSRKSDRDRRVTLVSLTELGKEIYQRVLNAWTELEHRTIGALAISEQAAFVALAQKIEPKLRGQISLIENK
jgi:DNA-binding MarR family transcriptional regulator